MGPSKLVKTHGLTGPSPGLGLGPGLGLARQESVCQVFRQVWNRTDLFSCPKPGPVIGHLDPLLTLQILLQSRLIMASKCISKLPRSWLWSTSLSSLDHGVQLYPLTHSITASQFPQSWHPRASPNSLNHGLGVFLYVHLITASKCISNLSPWCPLTSHNHDLQVGLQTRLITVWWKGRTRRQRSHHQHSNTCLMASEGNSCQRVVLAHGA